jgi:hypothetical protein
MAELYRIYDSADRLLYIGISLSAAVRLAEHRVGSSWWPDVRTIRIEHHVNRPAARLAELRAIRAERPLYNIEGGSAPGGRPEARQPAYGYTNYASNPAQRSADRAAYRIRRGLAV